MDKGLFFQCEDCKRIFNHPNFLSSESYGKCKHTRFGVVSSVKWPSGL